VSEFDGVTSPQRVVGTLNVHLKVGATERPRPRMPFRLIDALTNSLIDTGRFLKYNELRKFAGS
jgi:hypothetical protein